MDDLLFEPDAHEYKYRGLDVPSVTTILNPLYNFDGIPKDHVEYARLRGQAVHKACELYDQNDLDIDSLDPVIVPYLEAWIKFKADTGFIVHTAEKQLVHPTYRYAGCIDRLGHMGMTGKDSVLDIKCVAKLSPITGLQIAGYKALAELDKSAKYEDRYSVRLKNNGQYELKHYDSPDDFRVFLSLLNIFNWRKKHAI